MSGQKQTKAEKIADLERRVAWLEATVATLAARPAYLPYAPTYPFTYPYVTYSSSVTPT